MEGFVNAEKYLNHNLSCMQQWLFLIEGIPTVLVSFIA
jgi:hypothetical protein